MQFEKISEDKIRITFNLKDLEDKNITYHDFMANSIETQKIFLDMLNQAEKEIGFVTNNYKLMIEAMSSSDGAFILTVTRSKEEARNKLQKRVKVKRKTLALDETLPTLIYKFSSFDKIFDLCTHFSKEDSKSLQKTFSHSMIYYFKNDYYLLLKTNSKADINEIKYILSLITEFSDNLIRDYAIFENKLKEYGKVLIKNNSLLKLTEKIIAN